MVSFLLQTEHSVSSVNVVQDTDFACDSKGAQEELRGLLVRTRPVQTQLAVGNAPASAQSVLLG